MKFLLMFLLLTGCAAGLSTYEYEHTYADGEKVKAKVSSANELGNLEMGIEAQADGSKELKVKVDNLTKNDNTAEVVGSVRDIVHDVVRAATPAPIPDGN